MSVKIYKPSSVTVDMAAEVDFAAVETATSGTNYVDTTTLDYKLRQKLNVQARLGDASRNEKRVIRLVIPGLKADGTVGYSTLRVELSGPTELWSNSQNELRARGVSMLNGDDTVLLQFFAQGIERS